MSLLKKVVRKYTPKMLRERPPFQGITYSQEGEDRIIHRLLDCYNRDPGFYVDVGAHHPQRYSNTYIFYITGWRGINIEARPGSMEDFKKSRPRDINLERAISEKKECLTYFEFNDPAMNSFCEDRSLKVDGTHGWRITNRREIETVTLAEVLDEHLPPGQQIDFLTIDVEGMDMNVLRSNDWEKYRPSAVVVEDITTSRSDFLDLSESSIARYMYEQQYELFSRTVSNLIFRLTERSALVS